MAYPGYIVTRAVSVGGATTMEGGDALRMKVSIKSTKGLVWDATGYRFEKVTTSLPVSTAGEEVQTTLPCTDQAGWRDPAVNAIVDVSAPNSYSHRYYADVTFQTSTGKDVPGLAYSIGPFVLPAGGTVVDLDTVIATTTVAGEVVYVPDSWSSQIAALTATVAGLATPPDSSETVKGLIELATSAEAIIGTDIVRAVTPATLKAVTDALVVTVADASETVKGKVELATSAETITGTDAVRAVTPTGLKALVDAGISMDKTTDSATRLAMTAAQVTKLAGIATGATANSADATLLARANHTGTQSADSLTDGATNKVFLATERTKLTGIATGATVNSADATLLARANHTGTQSADTVVDGSTNHVFTAADDTKLAGIATSATANDTDANLKNRVNHTGVNPIAANITNHPVDEWQAAGGAWPNTTAEATRRVNWIGYPGLSTPPAASGRPLFVSGIDSYTLRT